MLITEKSPNSHGTSQKPAPIFPAREEANKARAEAAKGNDYAARHREQKTVPAQSVQVPFKKEPGDKTRQAKAATLGVNRGAVERVETIKRKAPELAEKVTRGEMSATNALREIKQPTALRTSWQKSAAKVVLKHADGQTKEKLCLGDVSINLLCRDIQKKNLKEN